MSKTLIILGCRGVPARHGGFETFAERLSLFLQKRGWRVIVYCQDYGKFNVLTSVWQGIECVRISVPGRGSLGSVLFDWKATRLSLSNEGILLTLGYNTAIFNLLNRLRGQINIINMDGIEWRRDKWSFWAKSWFWVNEKIGCRVGNHLIADNPGIEEHLMRQVSRSKITMIPYGGDEVRHAEESLIQKIGISRDEFSIIIARPEPENSFLEMIRAFSAKRRNHKLVVLGGFDPERNAYHGEVMQAASEEVIFLGPIYDHETLKSLRFFCRFYLHGHRVGGTNPSLVEALGAGCAVIAHKNKFNSWVAGPGAAYFKDEAECGQILDRLLVDDGAVRSMREASRGRFFENFRWGGILRSYEDFLNRKYPTY